MVWELYQIRKHPQRPDPLSPCPTHCQIPSKLRIQITDDTRAILVYALNGFPHQLNRPDPVTPHAFHIGATTSVVAPPKFTIQKKP